MPAMMRRRRLPQTESAIKDSVNKVDAVLCSDIHWRADAPICRTDDFQSAMDRKLKFIFDLCRKYKAPLLCGGDIGHRPQWPNWLQTRFAQLAKGVKIYSALGQHDLPGHSLDEFDRSGCGVLGETGVVNFDDATINFKFDKKSISIFISHWEEETPLIELNFKCAVLLTHRLVIQGKKEWPEQQAWPAGSLLKDYPQYKLILSGDNHIPFVVKYDGRLLVNPGSMMRSTAAQADHKPRVYLWDAEANEVAPVYLPIEPGVVDRSHIDVVDEKQERRQAMADRIKKGYEVSIDFEKNLAAKMEASKTPINIRSRVFDACKIREKK